MAFSDSTACLRRSRVWLGTGSHRACCLYILGGSRLRDKRGPTQETSKPKLPKLKTPTKGGKGVGRTYVDNRSKKTTGMPQRPQAL